MNISDFAVLAREDERSEMLYEVDCPKCKFAELPLTLDQLLACEVAVRSWLRCRPTRRWMRSTGTVGHGKTFTKQMVSRPDVALRVVDNVAMKKSVGRLRVHAGATSVVAMRALAGVVMLVSLAACGGTSSTASETIPPAGAASDPTSAPDLAASGSTVDAVATTGPVNVPELLQFTAPLVGGGEFKGSERAGQATAFWFWAPT